MTMKTRRGRFTPWCWEAERDEYNDESRRGWHLAKRTIRDMTYEYDPDVEYRYAIDYQHWHNENVYLELFELDGWELVGTVGDAFDAKDPGDGLFRTHFEGCWYIFRKEYDPGRPDVEYEITTDRESLDAFQRTLKRKYLWQLAIEIIAMLLWTGNVIYGSPRTLPTSIFTLTVWVLFTSASIFRLLCVTVLRPRKVLRGLYIPPRWQRSILVAVLFLILVAEILIVNQAERDAISVTVTAANTPVQLFLNLRPDITVDEVMVLAEEYDLETTASYGKRRASTGKRTLFSYYSYTYKPVYNIDFHPNADGEYDPGNSLFFYRGVAMAMNYDPDTMVLESAYLSMDTDHGRAYCHYFPGEPTMENCETGYNLFLRKSALSPQKYYHADTPEEIIAIAYPVLYPEGLE